MRSVSGRFSSTFRLAYAVQLRVRDNPARAVDGLDIFIAQKRLSNWFKRA
jgi:hypothetical protein